MESAKQKVTGLKELIFGGFRLYIVSSVIQLQCLLKCLQNIAANRAEVNITEETDNIKMAHYLHQAEDKDK